MRIHVIGLGVSERCQLLPAAEAALLSADRVLGSPRQWQAVAHLFAGAGAEQRFVPLPALAQLPGLLDGLDVDELAVLASGDPLFFGIGRWLSRHQDRQSLFFYPAISSIQAACHALHLSLQDVDVVSLHGRPPLAIRRWLRHQRTLVVLTDANSGPGFLAAECELAGFGQSTIHVCERLGYPNQQIRRFTVAELKQPPTIDPLHVVVIETAGEGGRYPEAPGIPDEAFITGAAPGQGMITKREVRLLVLSLLQPRRGDVVWDLGAGCGGIAVELALAQPGADIHAVEQTAERFGFLEQNRERFGVVENLHLHRARASTVLAGLPDPQRVFIGGSDGELEHLLEQAWQRLGVDGVCVCTAVTESTGEVLAAFAAAQPDCQLAGSEVGVRRRAGTADVPWTRKLPVTVYQLRKTRKHHDS